MPATHRLTSSSVSERWICTGTLELGGALAPPSAASARSASRSRAGAKPGRASSPPAARRSARGCGRRRRRRARTSPASQSSISGAAVTARTPASSTARAVGVGVPVHVPKAGGPGADHLHAGEPRPPVDVLVVHPLLDRPDVLGQPLHQRQVVGVAAKQGHRRVGVGVDEARHQRHPGAVDHLVAGGGLDPGPELGDQPVDGPESDPLAVERAPMTDGAHSGLKRRARRRLPDAGAQWQAIRALRTPAWRRSAAAVGARWTPRSVITPRLSREGRRPASRRASPGVSAVRLDLLEGELASPTPLARLSTMQTAA